MADIYDELRLAVDARDGFAFLKTVESAHYADLAALYQDLEEDEERDFFVRTLSPEIFSDVLADLPDSLREDAITRYQPSQQRELLAALSDDDRVDILQDMSDSVQAELLELLPQDQEELTRTLLNYDEDSAAGRMTTGIGRLPLEITVKGALDRLRPMSESAETLSRIFVVDDKERPIGFVRLRDLAFAAWSTPVRDIMFPVNQAILATADQEDAATMVKKYDLMALPVVDESNRLLGAITYDDAMEILEEESTEDIEKLVGISGEQSEETYLNTHLLTHMKRRVGWLLILGFLAIASGYVMMQFEEVLSSVTLLALFLPMVIATGGNTGGQASTMVIRAMALGEIEAADSLQVAWKELRLGILQGVLLGFVLIAVCLLILPAFRPPLPEGMPLYLFATAVSLALCMQVITSTLIGAILPIFARAIKLDPAVIAAPAITTLVDVTGMVIYFTITRYILGL